MHLKVMFCVFFGLRVLFGAAAHRAAQVNNCLFQHSEPVSSRFSSGPAGRRLQSITNVSKKCIQSV